MPQFQTADRNLTPGSLLPIRTVASLTGVNPVTLRAWERRYNLIKPKRTPKQHRLYTENDIVLIKQVLDLLDQGVSISQVKPLLDQSDRASEATLVREPGDVWKTYQRKMLNAIQTFDEYVLDSTYNDALSLYPVEIVSQRLIIPLLRILGESWKESETGIAEEHFFSAYLRNKLGVRIHHLNQRNSGPLLLLACLPGEYHEVGLLFFALASVNFGYRTLVLGANTPLDQLPGVLEKKTCQGIVLSSSTRPSRGVLENSLSLLVEQVDTPVFVGGMSAARNQNKIDSCGAIYIGETISQGLKKVNQTLTSDRQA